MLIDVLKKAGMKVEYNNHEIYDFYYKKLYFQYSLYFAQTNKGDKIGIKNMIILLERYINTKTNLEEIISGQELIEKLEKETEEMK